MFHRILLGVMALCVASPSSIAASWPERSIRLIVPYTPAGGTDLLGRMVAKRLGEALGVTIVVENKPGSDGSIGTDAVVKSAPDGYTLLIDGTSQAYNEALGKKLPYQTGRDLTPIVQTANQQVLLLVNAKQPFTNVVELIEYAKKNPGKLNYGSSSNANALPMELLKTMTGTDIVHVPYKGSGPMLTDLLSGQIELAMSGAAAPMPHVQAGSLRVLGIGDDRRSASMPDFPTIAEAGVPGFQTIQWSGLYAPAGTPAPIVDRINREVVTILNDPKFRQDVMVAGFDPVEGDNSPEHWRNLVASEVTKWSKIAQDVGLRAD
jgi:tripartite-type tricarboxylate transporter receptor subunit TctC